MSINEVNSQYDMYVTRSVQVRLKSRRDQFVARMWPRCGQDVEECDHDVAMM